MTRGTYSVDIGSQRVDLPVVSLNENLALALLITVDMGIAFMAKAGEELAEVLAPYDLDVVATVATMGIPLAVEVPLLLTRLTAPQRRERVAAALQLVGLADRSDHKPGELSGGQQQRVAIARALVADPSIFVCDEPTGDLDRQSAEGILQLLQMLNRDRGKTVIMVTHDPLAANHATRQIYLDKGLLVVTAARAA